MKALLGKAFVSCTPDRNRTGTAVKPQDFKCWELLKILTFSHISLHLTAFGRIFERKQRINFNSETTTESLLNIAFAS
jgi:hypothetical protein